MLTRFLLAPVRNSISYAASRSPATPLGSAESQSRCGAAYRVHVWTTEQRLEHRDLRPLVVSTLDLHRPPRRDVSLARGYGTRWAPCGLSPRRVRRAAEWRPLESGLLMTSLRPADQGAHGDTADVRPWRGCRPSFGVLGIREDPLTHVAR